MTAADDLHFDRWVRATEDHLRRLGATAEQVEKGTRRAVWEAIGKPRMPKETSR